MRIRVVESGGFAGLRRERVVETERLPGPEREVLESLVDATGFFALPARTPPSYPDALQYRIRVEIEHRAHEITVDDGSASEALLGLIARILEAAGGSPGGGRG